MPVENLQAKQTAERGISVCGEGGCRASDREVLQEILPKMMALSFPKAMKWNNSGVRFAGPVRWLAALYEGVTLPIQFAGVTAGNRTEGHRVLGRANGFDGPRLCVLCKGLERQGVIPDRNVDVT